MIVFFALLGVVCQIFVVTVVIWAIVARFSSKASDAFATFRASIAPIGLPLALVVAVITTGGSLYMSEVKNFTPCHLCWIQRYFLYPQVLLFGLLVWRPTLIWIRRLSVVTLVLCAPVSAYHYLIEWYPTLEATSCDLSNPCTLVWFREFGYITMPLLALSAGLTMLTLHALTRTNRTDPVEH